MTMQRTKQRVIFGALLCLHFIASAQPTDCYRVITDFLNIKYPQLTQEQKKEIIPCIFQAQNQGFLLDEKECKYDSAAMKIELALDAWIHLGDTLSQANLLKYLGYLNGRLERFSIGKQQIHEAKKLYGLKNAAFGVAVSLFDLAKVYTYENKLDSAIYFIMEAKQYWISQNVPSRIIGLNNHLIYLATLSDIHKDVETYIFENKKLVKKPDVYWQHELDFYFNSEAYYKKYGNAKMANLYAKKYKDKAGQPDEDSPFLKYSLYDPQNCMISTKQ